MEDSVRQPRVSCARKTVEVVLAVFAWLFFSVLAGFVSFALSSAVPAGKDFSQEETVGIIVRSGWPVWYRENAPGLSVMGGLKPDRAKWNFVFWTSLWLVLFGFLPRLLRSADKAERSAHEGPPPHLAIRGGNG